MTNPTIYAEDCTVEVITNAPPPTDPVWLAGQPVNQWIAIAGTDLNSMSPTELQPVVAAGLCNADGSGSVYGRPKQGIYAYSGGTIRKAGSEMLVFGGGGAGAWAGNELRGLRLEDDIPRWAIRSTPSPASAVWPKGSAPSHDYMQDGRPNARHSYQQPQFIDSLDLFMSFGCRNVWENDSSTPNNPVNACPWGGEWISPTPHPHLPTPETDAAWCIKNTNTEAIYSGAGSAIYQLLPPYTGAWTILISRADHPSVPSAGVGRALMSYDSVNNRICRIAWGAQGTHQYSTIDLNGAKSWTDATLSGPFASVVGTSGNGCGLIYDPGIDKHLYFKDDGFVYSLTWIANNNWQVDKLALAGTPPVANASQIAGSTPAAVWTRFQFVPNLRGFCLLQAYNKPAYFVRTIP